MSAVQYEVRAIIREDLCAAFEKYMIEVHIPQVMATNAFLSAHLAVLEPGKYRAAYTSPSHEVLRKYLTNVSPRLRDDVAKHFPDGVEFSREEWNVLATF